MKIAAIVVLYFPDVGHLIRNINSYSSYVDKLYIVDNSYEQGKESNFSLSIVEKEITHSNITLITHGMNLGIGSALNEGVESCIMDGYDYLLTMDQDSFFNKIQAEIYFASILKSTRAAALYSPFHGDDKINSYRLNDSTYITMTSGNVINIDVARTLGMFRDDFFIDQVDHYYCLKLQSKGYEIAFIDSVLTHELGDVSKWMGIEYHQHSLIRFYYFVRNGFVTIRDFPVYRSTFYKQMIIELVKYLLFEFKFSALGVLKEAISDFRQGKLGRR